MRFVAAASLLLLAVLPAHALYKVVGPDGRVTYTDRPPAASQGQAVPLGSASQGSSAAVLPAALREPVSRFPVVLYTMPDCQACDAGREFLRRRGIPYQERAAGTSPAENQAWQRQVGTTEAPALTVGKQVLRGFSAGDWSSYLDTAGYPGESRLPPGYVPPAPVPLVDTTSRNAAAPQPDKAPQPAAPAPALVPTGGFRF